MSDECIVVGRSGRKGQILADTGELAEEFIAYLKDDRSQVVGSCKLARDIADELSFLHPQNKYEVYEITKAGGIRHSKVEEFEAKRLRMQEALKGLDLEDFPKIREMIWE